jgi:glycosyltransferase involved in cell wall biosynthesis
VIKTKDKKDVLIVGAFPPPMHGMAAVNVAVYDAVRQAGVVPTVIDLAAPGLDRSIAARLRRLPRVLRGLGRLLGMRALRGKSLYMSVSGGLGQLYDVAFLLFARLRGMRLFLHHHSFAYLDRPVLLTRALVCAAGDDAVHIALSPGMTERLSDNYRVARVAAVSNAVFFFTTRSVEIKRKHLSTVGFLGNISAEKGIFEFLDLMAAVSESGSPLRARLAGPFQDIETERRVHSRLAALPHVEYVGPRYGAEKDAFYARIDALIFPTRYSNEAEPVTVHEAMSRGIPVVAYGRGSIPEIVCTHCGLVIDPAEPFVPAAWAQLERWLADATAFQAASEAAVEQFVRSYNDNEVRWRALLEDIVGVQLNAPRKAS